MAGEKDDKPFTVFEDLRGVRADDQGFGADADDDGGPPVRPDPFAEPPDDDDDFADDPKGDDKVKIVDKDDPDADDDGEPPAGDDDEPEELRGIKNPKVRDRIKREVELKNEARGTLDRVANEARHLYVDGVKAKEALARMTAASLDGEIAQVKADLVKAKEEGETAKEVDLQQKLNDLQIKQREASGTAEQFKGELERIEKGGELPVAKGVGQRSANPARDSWVEKRPWFKTNEEARLLVIAIDKRLNAAGKDPQSPEYFREIDREMKRRFPELYEGEAPDRDDRRGDDRRGRDRQSSGRQRGVAPVMRGNEAPRRSNSRVELSAQDVQTMKRFNLDPTNREHVTEYARNLRGAR